MLDAGEVFWVDETINDPGPVFDVGHAVLYPRIKDIGEAVSFEEDQGEDSNTFGKGIVLPMIAPDELEVVDGVDSSLMFFEEIDEIKEC